MKRRICVVVTARPSYARIKTALQAIQAHPDLELQLVVAASAVLERYGEALKNIRKDGFDVAASVFMVLEGENLVTSAKSTGLGMMELATVFDNLKPHMVITIADRYETLATAAAASYMNIPLVHMQGGEVTGSIDEKVRHAVTKLSDYHFTCTDIAAERVRKMGEDPSAVFVTGCPSIDLANEVRNDPKLNFDPFMKYGGVGAPVNLADGYVVVLQHPVTTEYEDSRQHILETLYAVKEVNIPTLWFWPNVDAGSDGTSKGIRWFREEEKPSKFHFFKNMEPTDFLRLVYNSNAIVGNSSVAIRECSFLGAGAVNIGTRQAGRERGANVIDVEYNRHQIRDAIREHMNDAKKKPSTIYGDGSAGPRIAALLHKLPHKIEKRLAY
ncbi:MAG TPA: UDP-N-acetylglucosamine 2-epimerase [Chthoniobacteraceae bacterium]|nr:UDP-N-acetylglucosamine 2-epimerase [Chthoniobacteraceae bacterium]